MPTPPAGHDCQTYDDTLYVSRPIIESSIEAWLREPKPQHLVRSLIGPPGTGKSWVLANLEERLLHSALTSGAANCIIRLDASSLIHKASQDDIKRYLIDTINRCCRGLVFPDDTVPSLPAIIERLRDRVCCECHTLAILLIVDGCDALASQDEWDLLQDILSRFFDNRTDCFRMLIARRNRLTDYRLRVRDQPIMMSVFEHDARLQSVVDEQMTKLRQRERTVIKEEIDFVKILPVGCTYQWNHPYINCFLMTNYLRNRSVPTANTLRQCCRSLTNRPATRQIVPEEYPPRGENDIDLLIRLANELPKQWTSVDFRHVSKRSLGVDDIQSGVIVNIQNSDGTLSPNYRIADGLRELLIDIATLQETENKS